MNIFVVSYNIQATGRVYDPLFRALSLMPFAQLLEDVWLIGFHGTAQELRDQLKPYFDLRDRLIILEFPKDSDWAIHNVNPKAAEWLQEFRP